MGSSTQCEIVPFMALLWEGDVCRDTCPCEPLQAIIEGEDREGGPPTSEVLCGWSLGSDFERVGDLYTEVLTKGDKKCHLVNSDQYAAGGGYAANVFSDDRDAVEELISDWDITPILPIAENAKCFQTL